MGSLSYANLIGFVMYVMVCAHPNTTYVVNVVSGFISNLKQAY